MLSFIVGSKIFSVKKKFIPKNSYLNLVHTTGLGTKKEDDIPIIELPECEKPEKEFQKVIDFLQFKSQNVNRKILDYLIPGGEDCIYKEILEKEEEIRENLYKGPFASHEMNKNPYYELIKIDKEFWEDLTLFNPTDPNLLDFGARIKKRDWDDIQFDLESLGDYISGEKTNESTKLMIRLLQQQGTNWPKGEEGKRNILAAGGRIFSILFGGKYSDTDLFLYDCDKQEAMNKIQDISNLFMGYGELEATRSSNTITFTKAFEKVQIILRLYKSVSEVLHSFDVDSCCVGYDGENLWMTKRCYFALVFGYNTVNLKFLSPNYELRLVKYCTRGMKLKIPNFCLLNISLKDVKEFYERCFEQNFRTISDTMLYINNSQATAEKFLRDVKISKEFSNQLLKGYIPPSSMVKELKYLELILFMHYVQRHGYDILESMLYGGSNYGGDESEEDTYSKQCGLAEILGFMEGKGELYSFSPTRVPDMKEKMEKLGEINRKDICGKFNTIQLVFSVKEGGQDIIMIRGRNKEQLEYILNIPEKHYDMFQILGKCSFPRSVELREIKEGERIESFASCLLKDNSVWYSTFFYNMNQEDKERKQFVKNIVGVGEVVGSPLINDMLEMIKKL